MAKGETYEEFTAKFEPKRTTDDCYTPPEVFDAVLGWACSEYGVDPSRVVRPFWPGGDYEAAEYPPGCVVVDNPPFSILSVIVAFYQDRGVRFLLFAPTLTCMGIRRCSKVVTGAGVTYENGAKVNTSFVTNMDRCEIRSAPALRRAAEEAQASGAAQPPSYAYPPELVTAPMLANMSRWGVDFGAEPSECSFTRALDAQRAVGKGIYGSGYLIGGDALRRREEADRLASLRGGGRSQTRDGVAALGPGAGGDRPHGRERVTFRLSDRERAVVGGLG